MPIYSRDRGSFLYTVDECAALSGKSRRTIQRYIANDKVYCEYHQVSFGQGATRTAFLDPVTLPVSSGIANVALPTSTTTEQSDTSQPKVFRSAEEPTLDLDAVKAQEVEDRAQRLRLIMEQSGRHRRKAIGDLAREKGVTPRTIYRWIADFENLGMRGLHPVARSTSGRPNIPADAYRLVISALISNPPSTPVAQIHRTLIRAVPDVMTYERGGQERSVSRRTVQRIRSQLEADPTTRLLFFDLDKRKEYLRTYAGEVVSAHANDLWQMDMTRCDVMVVDPESGRIFRPRVHAIIDVYSGCIPGVVFSSEEDQAQTDLAILRAVLPKSGPYAAKYPIFGVPQRLYLDNGKTYTSDQAHRVLSGLGVEVVHSVPRVSHTRGRIERFFGTLHSFERSLPGYVGKDARDRSSAELKRLTRRTVKWFENGGDPGAGDRLLTIGEYQNFVLAWLVAEYHAWPVDGMRRLEHFTQSAPAKTQMVLDRAELMLLFAERTARVVEPSGTIRLENQRWSIPDGSLIRFQGKKVLVLRDQFTLGDDRRLIVWKDRHGRLEVIGEAVPAPTVAASLEAGELRRATKAVAQRAVREAKKQAKELTDPELRVSTQLMREAEVVVEPVVPATPRGRLAAVNPVDPRDALDPNDPLARHLQDPVGSLSDGPSDPVERLKWIRERRKRDDS